MRFSRIPLAPSSEWALYISDDKYIPLSFFKQVLDVVFITALFFFAFSFGRYSQSEVLKMTAYYCGSIPDVSAHSSLGCSPVAKDGTLTWDCTDRSSDNFSFNLSSLNLSKK